MMREEKPNEIQSFRDLNAWKEAHQLAVMTYSITKVYPKEEIFGIVNQMRRSAVSIPSNIAEGFSRISRKEKIQFYTIALGSLSELQSQFLLSIDIGFLAKEQHGIIERQTILVSKLLNGLIKSLRASSFA